MKLFNNISLLKHNTFNVSVKAKNFVQFDSPTDILKWLEKGEYLKKFLVMGGGSNLLFTDNYEGTILYPAFKERRIVKEDGDRATVFFAAGEDWDQCVEWAVKNNLWGIENLSYIPGHAGAAPVQNIGAYGVELSELVETVEGIDLASGKKFSKTHEECHYDYRYSIFKGPLRGQTIITGVTLRLSKKPTPRLGYGSLKEEVEQMGEVSLSNIRKAVINTRKNKLPDPCITGNGGSFFKNPVVDNNLFKKLKDHWKEIPGYFLNDNKQVKIPAGWLIEKAGWKGHRTGNAGVHDKQALVLVNRGGATGREIADLAMRIQSDINKKFGILLEPEVNII